jgi:hypothetical protein
MRLVLTTGYADLPSNLTAEFGIPRLAKPFDQGELSWAVAEYAAPPAGDLWRRREPQFRRGMTTFISS